jgi:hypothetical protein
MNQMQTTESYRQMIQDKLAGMSKEDLENHVPMYINLMDLRMQELLKETAQMRRTLVFFVWVTVSMLLLGLAWFGHWMITLATV